MKICCLDVDGSFNFRNFVRFELIRMSLSLVLSKSNPYTNNNNIVNVRGTPLLSRFVWDYQPAPNWPKQPLFEYLIPPVKQLTLTKCAPAEQIRT